MQLRHLLPFVAVVCLSSGTAFADPPSAIYISTGSGRQVLAIAIDPATGVQTGNAQTLVTAASAVRDVTQKADGGLFYATADAIRRIGQAGVVASVAGVQELRFSAYDCLFYSSGGGVNSVGCGNTGSSAGAGGNGLGFTMFGQILAISGTTVVRIPLDAAGNKGTPSPVIVSGLTAPGSIAVAAGEGTNGLQRGDFVVTDGRFARLYDKTGNLKNAAYASVPADQTINFADFDSDDRLWLAAMVSDTASNALNGRVYRVDEGGAVCQDSGGTNCVRAALVPKVQGKYWGAVGLALGTSSRLLTHVMVPGVPNVQQTFAFDFGSSIVEVSGIVIDSCELRVRASTTQDQTGTSLINDPQYSLNPYLGDEGLATVYRIESFKGGMKVEADACVEVSPANKPSVFIAALTSTEISPRILRCDSTCNEAELFGWWHTGPIDGDASGIGRDDGWSDWLIVEKDIQAAGNQIQFCGIGVPLKLDGSAVFNPGSNLTVRAQFSVPGGSCGSGMYLTDPNAKFLISLTQVSPAHDKKTLIASSGNSGTPPTLGLAGQSYDFELSLKEADGTAYAEGTYEITLTDVTPGGARLGAPATIYFSLGKK